MIDQLMTLPKEAYWAAGGAVVLGAAFAGGFYFAVSREIQSEVEALGDEGEAPNGFKLKGRPGAGLISSYMRDKKKAQALRDGSVRWHLVGSSFEQPRFVEPERDQGGDIPQLEHDGKTYLFPEESAVYSEEEGVPTYIHRKGEADPVELRDGWDHSIDAKSLSSYLTMVVTSDNPNKGLVGGILGDYTPMQIFRMGLLAIIGGFVLIQLLP